MSVIHTHLNPYDKCDDIYSSIETSTDHIGIWMNKNMLKLKKKFNQINYVLI